MYYQGTLTHLEQSLDFWVGGYIGQDKSDDI